MLVMPNGDLWLSTAKQGYKLMSFGVKAHHCPVAGYWGNNQPCACAGLALYLPSTEVSALGGLLCESWPHFKYGWGPVLCWLFPSSFHAGLQIRLCPRVSGESRRVYQTIPLKTQAIGGLTEGLRAHLFGSFNLLHYTLNLESCRLLLSLLEILFFLAWLC